MKTLRPTEELSVYLKAFNVLKEFMFTVFRATIPFGGTNWDIVYF